MKDYLLYQCDDFVADSYFRQWVKQPTAESDHFWNDFLASHPDRTEIVHQAVAFVRKLSEATTELAAPVDKVQEAAVWMAIQEQLRAAHQPTEPPFVVHSSPRRWIGWAVAASVTVVISVGLWFWVTHPASNVQNQPIAGQPPNTLLEQHNQTIYPQLVSLPDGSSVILQKGSRISYRRSFVNSTREVTLAGEAYFEVAKDARHPFIVRTSELVTKVLGTSFNVRAYTHDAHVTVTVRSGRVAVFTSGAHTSNPAQKLTPTAPDSVILTRNQQLVFARQQAQLVQRREVILPTASPKGSPLNAATFVYNATPVSEIFRELERVYGITITYDANALKSCHLTTNLADEPLAGKMTIICKSIEATYTVQGNHFSVSGRGCQ